MEKDRRDYGHIEELITRLEEKIEASHRSREEVSSRLFYDLKTKLVSDII